MFIQKFHILSHNLLSHFLVLMGLIVGTVALGVHWSDQDNEKLQKEKLAKIVGYQALQIFQDQRDSLLYTTDKLEPKILGQPQRAPASTLQPVAEGTIGKDPWGHPYLYKILQHPPKNIQVIVLSQGENQKLDTLHFISSPSSSEFLGDDYGVTLHF